MLEEVRDTDILYAKYFKQIKTRPEAAAKLKIVMKRFKIVDKELKEIKSG